MEAAAQSLMSNNPLVSLPLSIPGYVLLQWEFCGHWRQALGFGPPGEREMKKSLVALRLPHSPVAVSWLSLHWLSFTNKNISYLLKYPVM